MSRSAILLLAVAGVLAGCADGGVEVGVVEVVRSGRIDFELRAQGQIKATRATPLTVPGRQWTRRQLIWMVADGSRVRAGETVARFAAADAELELEKALLDLQRNALARAAKESEMEIGAGRIDVDLIQTRSLLDIAQRYANADIDALARNVILDAIQDEGFLSEKQGVLSWRQGMSRQRGAAEMGLLGAQRATAEGKAESRREDMAALSLDAPHDGVFVLEADWSGGKPQIGSDFWAGNSFASLPGSGALEVELQVPQIEAQGLLHPGLEVRLWPLGRPEQAIDGALSWLASAPQTRSRESPVKYVAMKAPIPSEAANAHGWVPGQAFEAVIVIGRAEAGLSVANLALQGGGDTAFVQVLEDGQPTRRSVELGRRGMARTEILAGLDEGDRVLLAAPAAGDAR